MERTSRDAWATRIEKWKASGRSAKEFAAELGIKPRTLVWWKWRLGSEKSIARRAKPAVLAVRKRAEPISPLTFIEMTSAMRSEPLEVVLPSDVRVRVPSTFDSGTLTRLLDVLERRR